MGDKMQNVEDLDLTGIYDEPEEEKQEQEEKPGEGENLENEGEDGEESQTSDEEGEEEKPEDEPKEGEGDKKDEKPELKRVPRAEKRIHELTAKAKEAERKLAEREAELELYKRQVEEAKRPKFTLPLDREITLEDVDHDPDKLVEARIMQYDAIMRQKTEAQALATSYHAKVTAAMAEDPKYAAFRASPEWQTIPINGAMAREIQQAENPAGLEVALHQNRAFALRLTAMTPAQVAVEIARLDGRLSALKTKKATKPQTKAPAPVNPSSGKSQGKAKADDDPDAWWRKIKTGK
jgi:hypothetical protein